MRTDYQCISLPWFGDHSFSISTQLLPSWPPPPPRRSMWIALPSFLWCVVHLGLLDPHLWLPPLLHHLYSFHCQSVSVYVITSAQLTSLILSNPASLFFTMQSFLLVIPGSSEWISMFFTSIHGLVADRLMLTLCLISKGSFWAPVISFKMPSALFQEWDFSGVVAFSADLTIIWSIWVLRLVSKLQQGLLHIDQWLVLRPYFVPVPPSVYAILLHMAATQNLHMLLRCPQRLDKSVSGIFYATPILYLPLPQWFSSWFRSWRLRGQPGDQSGGCCCYYGLIDITISAVHLLSRGHLVMSLQLHVSGRLVVLYIILLLCDLMMVSILLDIAI